MVEIENLKKKIQKLEASLNDALPYRFRCQVCKVQSTTVNSSPGQLDTILNSYNSSGHTPLTSYVKMYGTAVDCS